MSVNVWNEREQKAEQVTGFGRWEDIAGKPFEIVDTQLSKASANPVQNKAIAEALENFSGDGVANFAWQDWKDLPQAEKDKYDGKTVIITDDYESSICSSVAECEASINPNDVAGASALVELNNSLAYANGIGTSLLSEENFDNANFECKWEKKAGFVHLFMHLKTRTDLSPFIGFNFAQLNNVSLPNLHTTVLPIVYGSTPPFTSCIVDVYDTNKVLLNFQPLGIPSGRDVIIDCTMLIPS